MGSHSLRKVEVRLSSIDVLLNTEVCLALSRLLTERKEPGENNYQTVLNSVKG